MKKVFLLLGVAVLFLGSCELLELRNFRTKEPDIRNMINNSLIQKENLNLYAEHETDDNYLLLEKVLEYNKNRNKNNFSDLNRLSDRNLELRKRIVIIEYNL